MLDLGEMRRALPEVSRRWLDEALARLQAEPEALAEVFPQLPRRIGREPLARGRVSAAGAIVEQGAWRMCDAAALATVQAAGVQAAGVQAAGAEDDVLVDLFLHGDLEERAMVLRCLSLLPITPGTLRLLAEVQRTNTVSHFEAAVCESNLAVRALEHADFGEEDFNRLILKLAFLDLPLDRALGVEKRANRSLSRMLHGLATERRAAGRTVWGDTDRMIALAPLQDSATP